MVFLAYFFGWRAGTVSALCYWDITFIEAGGVVTARFAERTSKGASTRAAHLFRQLELASSTAPGCVTAL